MDWGRLINQIINMVLRRAVNTGINAGVKHLTKGSAKNSAKGPNAQGGPAHDSREAAKRARQAARLNRR